MNLFIFRERERYDCVPNLTAPRRVKREMNAFFTHTGLLLFLSSLREDKFRLTVVGGRVRNSVDTVGTER